MASMFNSTYQLASLSVPNRQVAALEVWDAKIAMLVGTGRKKDTLDLLLKFTYEGARTVNGKTEALVTVNGEVERREKGGPSSSSRRPKSRIIGQGNFDLAGGFFSKLKVSIRNEAEFDGMSIAQIFEVNLKRVAGNPNNIGPLPPRNNPGTPPPAGGQVVLQRNGVLQATDPPNAKRPGTHQKVFDLNMIQGKTYVIDLKKAPGRTWIPISWCRTWPATSWPRTTTAAATSMPALCMPRKRGPPSHRRHQLQAGRDGGVYSDGDRSGGPGQSAASKGWR